MAEEKKFSVPTVVASADWGLEFKGNTKIEMHYGKGYLGDVEAPEGATQFIYNFFVELSRANNGDTTYIKERLKEIDDYYVYDKEHVRIYSAEEIRHIINITHNIVKSTCKELEITQKELADKLGASEGTVRNWSSSNELPQWAINFIETLKENKKNKEIADTVKKLLELSK